MKIIDEDKVKKDAISLVKKEKPFCDLENKKKTKQNIKSFNERVSEVFTELMLNEILIPELSPMSLFDLKHSSNPEKGIVFENIVKEIFSSLGYKTIDPDQAINDLGKKKPKDMTAGDFGIDLILIHPESERRIGVQCKCNQAPNVSSSVVSSTIAGLNFYECNEGIIVSTSLNKSNSAKMLADNQHIKINFMLYNEIDSLYKNYLNNQLLLKNIEKNNNNSQTIIKSLTDK